MSNNCCYLLVIAPNVKLRNRMARKLCQARRPTYPLVTHHGNEKAKKAPQPWRRAATVEADFDQAAGRGRVYLGILLGTSGQVGLIADHPRFPKPLGPR